MSHDPARGWYVDMPTYNMIAGTVLPIVANKTTANGVLAGTAPNDAALANLTVEVEIPDEYGTDDKSAIDPERVRRLHRGHPTFGRNNWTPPTHTDP